MSQPRKPARNSSRRTFLKAAAGVTAGTVLAPRSVWAQVARTGEAIGPGRSRAIDPRLMISAEQAWDWHVFKSQCGPTYAGSTGWKRFTDFLISKMPELGAVDLDYVEIPYDHYIVEDWPDRRTHMHDSGVRGREARHRRDAGAGRCLLRHDVRLHASRGHHGADGLLRPRASARRGGYRRQDPRLPDRALSRPALRQLVPRQLHADRLRVAVAGQVVAALHAAADERVDVVSLPLGLESAGRVREHRHQAATRRASSSCTTSRLARRSAWRSAASTRQTARPDSAPAYVNCPTLTLDRVNGAKVLADAKAGKMATLTLTARFQRDTGKAIIAYLPGKNYGTPRDEQVLIATHTDAMSLIEENGGLGMLGIMSYFNRLPRAARPRTLVFYFDCRHFMPGGEASWPQFDYYTIHPERLKTHRRHHRHRAHGRPTDDRDRARRQPVRLLERAS